MPQTFLVILHTQETPLAEQSPTGSTKWLFVITSRTFTRTTLRSGESPRIVNTYASALTFDSSSGATIDNTIVPAFSTSIKSVTEQVGQFISNLGSKPSYAPWTSSTAIFSFFIGINDIGMTL